MLRGADAAAPDGRGPLRALHLGFTRVGPAGVDALTQLRGLTALSFEGEDITSDFVQVCPDYSSSTTLSGLPRLPCRHCCCGC